MLCNSKMFSRSVYVAFLGGIFLISEWIFSSLVAEPAPSNMGTSVGKSCPPLQARCGSVSRLMVTPRVSGLERSQEKSLEQHFPEPVCSSTSSAPFSCLPSPVTVSGTVTRPSPYNGNGSRPNGSPPLSKPKPFLTLSGRSHSIYNINNRSYKYFTIFPVIFTFFFCGSYSFGLHNFISPQEQHPSQTSFIYFSSCIFLILHATPNSLYQGLGILRFPATTIPDQLRDPVHILARPASSPTSAPRSHPLGWSRYTEQKTFVHTNFDAATKMQCFPLIFVETPCSTAATVVNAFGNNFHRRLVEVEPGSSLWLLQSTSHCHCKSRLLAINNEATQQSTGLDCYINVLLCSLHEIHCCHTAVA